jgi:cell division protein FtsB
MGLKRVRVDSIKELKKQKTTAQLQQENEELKKKVTTLENDLDSTNLALCDVYEQLLAATSAGEV